MSNETDVLKSARFVYSRYPEIQERYPFWQLLSFLDRFPKNYIYIKENDNIVGIGIYVMIDDLGLDRIATGIYDIRKPEGIRKVFERPGDNLHFIAAATDNVKIVLQGLKTIIKQRKPKSVSWFKPDMDRIHFIKMRGKLCHHL
jgi:hypothetical protein